MMESKSLQQIENDLIFVGFQTFNLTTPDKTNRSDSIGVVRELQTCLESIIITTTGCRLELPLCFGS